MQHNSMGEHTEKQFVYLRQKQGRKTHLERKGVGIPPNEGAQWRGGLNHLSRTVLPGLCLHLANYLVSFFTPDWSQDPPQHACSIFAKMDPTPEACGCMSTLIMGWRSLPFWPPRRLLVHGQTGESSLTSGVGALSLYFSRAQLLPLALSLECLGANKASILLHLTNTSCSAQGHVYLLPQSQLNQSLGGTTLRIR